MSTRRTRSSTCSSGAGVPAEAPVVAGRKRARRDGPAKAASAQEAPLRAAAQQQLRERRRWRRARASSADAVPAADCCFTLLPREALREVALLLDAASLLALCTTCRALRGGTADGNARLSDWLTQQWLAAHAPRGQEPGVRWRSTPQQQLRLCAAFGGLDARRCLQHGFSFAPESAAGAPPHELCVKLPGMGPRVLLSASTAAQPLLHWKLRVRGNVAFELACLPDLEVLLSDARAVHKCVEGEGGVKAVGFHSEGTLGSMLTHRLLLVRDSCIEVLARRGLLRVVITSPSPERAAITVTQVQRAGGAAHSRPTAAVVRHLELRFSDAYDVRLAATAWHRAELRFDIPFAAHLDPAALEPDAAAAEAAE